MKTKTIIYAVATAMVLAACGPAPAWTDLDKQQLQVGDDIAVVPTEYGKVQGFIMRDVYTFLGIPYGHETSGEYRFMPPVAPEPWTEVKPCVFNPPSCPQDIYGRGSDSFSAFVDHWNYDEMSEDCLKLNIWTPAVGSGKRPVLVWLHGGGFSNGNLIEQDGYNGENFSRYGDVVFCSVNHRLNSLGFSDFAGVGGEKYAHSGNVGMLDIVAALQWIHDNIEAFGGDPDNVTIMGQSGGGAKVCVLCNMPAAKGLFAKAVALSGSSVRGTDKEAAEALGAAILDEAGIAPADIDKLQQMTYQEYREIAKRAAAKVATGYRAFSPVADGLDIIEGDFFDPANDQISDVPMLICTTFHEWNPDRDNAKMENMTKEDVIEAITPTYGERADTVVNAFAENFPDKSPIELYSMILSSRKRAVECADMKLRQSSPVYVAWFGKQNKLFNGRHRAFHCSDISYWFLNTDLMITHTGGGKEARKLSYKMANALLSFMKTGAPKAKGLPRWQQYSTERGETMVLNDVSEMKNNPDSIARAAL